MAAEQPPKKRKNYEPLPESPSPPPPASESTPSVPPSPPQTLPPPPTPPLSQEEILSKRRNKDEIRSVHECLKRIKFSLSQKEGPFMSDLEQSYLALISASRENWQGYDNEGEEIVRTVVAKGLQLCLFD